MTATPSCAAAAASPRAAIGLGSVFTHLKAQLNWHQMFHELIADFSVEKLAARQSEALAKVGLG